MNYRTPEQMGISSRNVLAFYKELDDCGLSTHSVILSRGDAFFSECYYAPFHKDFYHRMYSTTKSFVAVAVGFCEQDGLLSLDDPIGKFFPEYADMPAQHATTVREMLQMRTDLDKSGGWFTAHLENRAQYYFTKEPQKYPGTLFLYDSAANFMLCVIVEKVTGKPFLDYLREKFLDDIGFSKEAYCLQCPGGNSWGDSGLLCTARDLWLFARFMLNGGTWDGKRYLNEAFVKEATACKNPTGPYGFRNLHGTEGYGYQFWGAADGCFATKGMGNQVSFCDPKHDFVFVINSCNQGNDMAYYQIYRALYSNIIANLGEPLPEDPQAKAELDAYLADKKLFTLPKRPVSPLAQKVAGRIFRCPDAPNGMRWFRFDFDGNEGTFTFENATGEKVIPFGFGHNVFEKFPEEGYSDLVGATPCPGNKYDAAFCAEWTDERTMRIRVQIIDKYFGNMAMLFGFRDEKHVTVRIEKTAEAFLNEYPALFCAEAE